MFNANDPGLTALARAGGYAKAAKYDTTESIRPARKGFVDRFLKQVDPDNVLPEAERQRRADAALKAHMTVLAAKSARKRRKPNPKGRAA